MAGERQKLHLVLFGFLVCEVKHEKYIVVQLPGCIRRLVTPQTAAHLASLHLTISLSCPKLMSIESVMPSNHLTLCHSLLFLPSIFPASGSFPIGWLFMSGSQSIGIFCNYLGLFPLGLTGLTSLQSEGPSKVFSSTTIQKHQFFWTSAFFIVQLSQKMYQSVIYLYVYFFRLSAKLFPAVMKKQESSRKTSVSALLTMPKPLTVWITINCGKS